jgi:hypothetical protein
VTTQQKLLDHCYIKFLKASHFLKGNMNLKMSDNATLIGKKRKTEEKQGAAILTLSLKLKFESGENADNCNLPCVLDDIGKVPNQDAAMQVEMEQMRKKEEAMQVEMEQMRKKEEAMQVEMEQMRKKNEAMKVEMEKTTVAMQAKMQNQAWLQSNFI